MNLYVGIVIAARQTGGFKYQLASTVCNSSDEMLGLLHRIAGDKEKFPRDVFTEPTCSVWLLDHIIEHTATDVKE